MRLRTLAACAMAALALSVPSAFAAAPPPPASDLPDALLKPVTTSIADIIAPASGQHLGDLTVVTGTATCAKFLRWELEYKTSAAVEWTFLERGLTAVTADTLAAWDTSALAEGDYDLRLSVYSSKGLAAQDEVTVNMTYVPCGDINGDFVVDMADVDHMTAWMFEGGPPPFQMRAANVDLFPGVNVADLVYLTNYVVDCDHAPCAFTCGDVNHDFLVDQADVDSLVAYMFENGPEPIPLEAADVNCDGEINIADLEYLVGFVIEGGQPPCLYCFLRGDCDYDDEVNNDDVCFLSAYMFEGGEPPVPLEIADVNCDGEVNIADLVYLEEYVCCGGPPPCDSTPILMRDLARVPAAPALDQNHPNPFNPRTTIAYNLPERLTVSLAIYDVAGRLVRTLVSRETQDTGRHEAVWDGKDAAGREAAAGVYFYNLSAGNIDMVRRMVLLK